MNSVKKLFVGCLCFLSKAET